MRGVIWGMVDSLHRRPVLLLSFIVAAGVEVPPEFRKTRRSYLDPNAPAGWDLHRGVPEIEGELRDGIRL